MGKEQKADTGQQQFWQMVLETWHDSGLPVSKFCKAEGLSEGSFYNWRKKLAKGNKFEAAKQKERISSAFIEVSIPSEKSGGLELVLISGNTLRISSGADKNTLTGVISVLREAGLC